MGQLIVTHAPTSSTFTPPAGVTSIDVLVIGGGGGGNNSSSMSGGGGGGGSIYRTAYPVIPGNPYAYVIGSGGSADINGDDSTFDGLTAQGGRGALSITNGAGGTGDFAGGNGGSGDGSTQAGGGGGAAGTSAGGAGTSGSFGGAGGSGAGASGAFPAGGDGGAGGALNIAGINGVAPGGGGGGYGAVTSAAGVGGDGYLQIEWVDPTFKDASINNNAYLYGESLTMKKNTAGQKIGSQMTTAIDGSDFTGTVTVYVTGDAGTQGIGTVGSGICTHEGFGYHTYAPSQAETNYTLIAFTFVGTGAVTCTVQTITQVDANVLALNGVADGITGFERASRCITTGAASGSPTTTSIPTTGLSPAATVTDQFKGQILAFDKDTTTTALRGQKTDITGSSAGGTLTVSALTTAPASGDTFVIE